MNYKGFTMISVLVALIILSIFFTGLLMTFNFSILLERDSNRKYEMARSAQGTLEEFKGNISTGVNYENISFTPYSSKYINYFTTESIVDDDLLFLSSVTTNCNKENTSISIFKITYINPNLRDNFYYMEYSINP